MSLLVSFQLLLFVLWERINEREDTDTHKNVYDAESFLIGEKMWSKQTPEEKNKEISKKVRIFLSIVELNEKVKEDKSLARERRLENGREKESGETMRMKYLIAIYKREKERREMTINHGRKMRRFSKINEKERKIFSFFLFFIFHPLFFLFLSLLFIERSYIRTSSTTKHLPSF